MCSNALRFGNAAFVRGRHTFLSGDPGGARSWLETASDVFEEEGARGQLAWTQCMLASVECCEAPIDAGANNPELLNAANRCDVSLAVFRETGHGPGVSRALGGRAYAAYKQGDWALALAILQDVLVSALDEGRVVLTCVEDIADIAGRADRPELAARLYGATTEDRRMFGRVVQAVFRNEVEAEIAAVRSLLGEASFAKEFDIGRSMPIETAVFEALAFASEFLAPAPIQLTSREQEILDLLIEDSTAQEIADQLYLSRRTVETHLANLYAKLGVHTRAEALAAAYEQGLLSND
jgi:DNA-binding CsgD family transcriptional regulator